MNGLLVFEIVAFIVWILSMIYHRRDVQDERGRLVVLKSNNFAYGIVLVGLSVVIIVDRFVAHLSQQQFIMADAIIILAGLVASALSMFVYNKLS